MLVELAQLLRREFLLLKKLEHSGRAIVTGKVVRRACPPRRTRIVADPSTHRCSAERREFAKPPRHHRPEIGVLRKSQERIAWPKLTVLVPTAHNVGTLQP